MMFETVFRIAVAGSPASDRRWRSLPVSFALHGAALACVALLSARALTDPPEPETPIVFLKGSAPPLPLGDSSSALHRTHPDEHIVAETVIPLQEIPQEPETRLTSIETPAPERGDDSSTGGASGDSDGKRNGVPSGLSDSDGREGPRAGDSQTPLPPGGDVNQPRLVHKFEPPYPEAARKAHLEGTVILQAIIGVGGRVEELAVVRSTNALLDAAALRAVEQWRYRPATLNGRAVRVSLTVTVEFRLR